MQKALASSRLCPTRESSNHSSCPYLFRLIRFVGFATWKKWTLIYAISPNRSDVSIYTAHAHGWLMYWKREDDWIHWGFLMSRRTAVILISCCLILFDWGRWGGITHYSTWFFFLSYFAHPAFLRLFFFFFVIRSDLPPQNESHSTIWTFWHAISTGDRKRTVSIGTNCMEMSKLVMELWVFEVEYPP